MSRRDEAVASRRCPGDAADPAQAAALAEEIRAWGYLDRLWLNAGYAAIRSVEEIDADFFDAMMAANVRGPVLAGVTTIFQELDLVPSLDVTANLFLGRELTRAGVLDRPAMRRAARFRLEAVGVEIDVDQPVAELSVGRRQIGAIVKALTYASRILVMDEPTAALTAAEVDRLFAVMRDIAARGVGIV